MVLIARLVAMEPRLSADPQTMTMAIKAVFGSPSPGAPHRTGRIARASLRFSLATA
jgi:hypothetical protein